MRPQLEQLSLILQMNQRLFLNTLANITDEQFSYRITEHNNSIEWIATHTVWARFNMLVFLGKPWPNPYQGLFEGFKSIKSGKSYSNLDEVTENWKRASALLWDALEQASDEHLQDEAPIPNPIGDNSNLGTLAFLVQHESYDIGQLGFLKKYFTKEAMAY
ncbi:DinB family protein [Mangrovimonas aestuarii]|uniref:DinB family protein n=1 Tax=Mangrovimonas aestuarii TaxID=3018443 RepID=UPI002379CE01|nr:DinB family protein [Mangrovimonas aestuarii]